MNNFFEQLSIFMTLAEKCHYGKTSEKHHITVSTLTRLIQRLEEDLKTSLFKRNNRRVKLTQSGEQVYTFAKEIQQRYTALQSQLNPKSDAELSGRITLYSTVTAAYHILPPLLKAFKSQFPAITTYLETGPVKQGYDKLLADDIDFYIGIISKKVDTNYLVKKIYETPLILISPIDFELEKDTPLPLILPEHEELAERIEHSIKELKIPINIHSQVKGHEAILAMVSAGLGCAMLPEIVVNKSYLNTQIKEINTKKALPILDIGLFVKKEENSRLSPQKTLFWEFI